jgi:c-di-GMP-related signal transduction protein
VFERFIARQAILKDNLTLLGYDIRFRAEDASRGASRTSCAAYLMDSSTMVFCWESLTAHGLAFFVVGEQDLLTGAPLILPRRKTVVVISAAVPCTPEVIMARELSSREPGGFEAAAREAKDARAARR